GRCTGGWEARGRRQSGQRRGRGRGRFVSPRSRGGREGESMQERVVRRSARRAQTRSCRDSKSLDEARKSSRFAVAIRGEERSDGGVGVAAFVTLTPERSEGEGS